ncbi:MAG: hypothetical protein VX589_16935 [Myxococcota bacterium]|nr:hypothetical protein [Myxococcota bacterium]
MDGLSDSQRFKQRVPRAVLELDGLPARAWPPYDFFRADANLMSIGLASVTYLGKTGYAEVILVNRDVGLLRCECDRLTTGAIAHAGRPGWTIAARFQPY